MLTGRLINWSRRLCPFRKLHNNEFLISFPLKTEISASLQQASRDQHPASGDNEQKTLMKPKTRLKIYDLALYRRLVRIYPSGFSSWTGSTDHPWSLWSNHHFWFIVIIILSDKQEKGERGLRGFQTFALGKLSEVSFDSTRYSKKIYIFSIYRVFFLTNGSQESIGTQRRFIANLSRKRASASVGCRLGNSMYWNFYNLLKILGFSEALYLCVVPARSCLAAAGGPSFQYSNIFSAVSAGISEAN